MKNIFGLNKSLYSAEGSEEFDGAPFITAKLSKEEAVEDKEPKKVAPALPLPLSILQYVFVALFAICLGVWVSSGVSFTLMMGDTVYLPTLLMLVGLVGFIVIAIIDVAKSKKFAKENGLEKISEVEDFVEIHEVDEEAEAAEEARVKSELGIPEDAHDMDFLSFFYREGADGVFPIKPFDFMTLEMFAYADGESLHIADFNSVYSIPLSSIKSIEKIEKETTLLGWSKDESFDSEKFSQYGITENSAGFIVISCYYKISISAEMSDDEIEDFCLLIPPYEYDAFSALTGINA